MPAIRRHIHIATTPRAVWNALTTAEGLGRWLADEVRIEPRQGGRVVLTRKNAEGETVEARGLIHKWRPISHFEIAFERLGSYPGRGSHLAFQLTQDGGEARLSLQQSGGEALDDAETTRRLDDQWRADFARLQALLDAP